jgi:hypothetical protein
VGGELIPGPDQRVSDAERDSVVEQLHQAVGEGRLTLIEFEERLGAVLASRTHGELRPHLADLPAAAVLEVVELRASSSSIKRAGRWLVPRRLAVTTKSSKVRLDFTEAAITGPVVETVLDVRSSSVTLVLPPGASADADGLEMASSSLKVRVPRGGGLHFTVAGRIKSTSVTVRYQRRFLRWRW